MSCASSRSRNKAKNALSLARAICLDGGKNTKNLDCAREKSNFWKNSCFPASHRDKPKNLDQNSKKIGVLVKVLMGLARFQDIFGVFLADQRFSFLSLDFQKKNHH